MEETTLVTISGIDTTIDLLSDRIRFNREAIPTVEILLSAITSIKIEHQNYQGNLQIFTAAITETIAFPVTRSKVFELFKLELERVIQAPNSSLKGLVMLEKLGELKDKGFITEEEFNTKKQQVLGSGIDSINIESIKKAMESAVVAEEEKKTQRIQKVEIAKKARLEEREQGGKILGSVLGCLCLPVILVAFTIGCVVNGFFMLLTAIALSPLIHFLAKGLSKGRIHHVPLAYRLTIVFITMILSTFHYFRIQPQGQVATETEASTTSITQPQVIEPVPVTSKEAFTPVNGKLCDQYIASKKGIGYIDPSNPLGENKYTREHKIGCDLYHRSKTSDIASVLPYPFNLLGSSLDHIIGQSGAGIEEMETIKAKDSLDGKEHKNYYVKYPVNDLSTFFKGEDGIDEIKVDFGACTTPSLQDYKDYLLKVGLDQASLEAKGFEVTANEATMPWIYGYAADHKTKDPNNDDTFTVSMSCLPQSTDINDRIYSLSVYSYY